MTLPPAGSILQGTIAAIDTPWWAPAYALIRVAAEGRPDATVYLPREQAPELRIGARVTVTVTVEEG